MFKKIASALVVLTMSVGFVAATAAPAAAAVYWGCPAGVACVWQNTNGGGNRITIAVGQYGYNNCANMTAAASDTVSSASADFGGGWDLVLYAAFNCGYSGPFGEYDLSSSGSVNFTGLKAWFNDEASSFSIRQL